MTFDLNPGQQRAFDDTLTSGARHCLLYGGSRSGKTALMVSCILDRALIAPGSRHLIVRKEASSAKRAIVKDTLPKIWEMKFPEAGVPKWSEIYGYYSLPNKSEIWVGGLNDAQAMERILGNEYTTVYVNEASEVTYDAFVLLKTRLAQSSVTVKGKPLSQRLYLDLNPTTRMHWTYRLFREGIEPQDETPADPDQHAYSVINPYDNAKNLSGDYLISLEALPARSKKRFLDGEYVSDDENALWRRSYIKRTVLGADGDWPVKMRRIVVAIDPAVTNNPGSDETGIVAVGLGVDGFGYVLEDASGKFRPDEWARRAVSVYQSLGADKIIGEVNNGGDLIEATLRAVAPEIPYRAVRATRGKGMRAEPVAALYERGKVMHLGVFPELEDQMCSVTVGFDSKSSGWSPDRVDALVWGFTELFPALAARVAVDEDVPLPQFSMV